MINFFIYFDIHKKMELYKDHKRKTKVSWKKRGLITDNFEGIYLFYINCTHCELCNKKFTNTKDRQMEHNHATGEFRNVVCHKCNQRKSDRKIQSNNSSGYKGIYKHISKNYTQGFRWEFRGVINGKRTTIKSSIDKEWLIQFAETWRKENNYYT